MKEMANEALRVSGGDENLVAIRTARGLNQTELAELSGIPRSTINKIEKGTRRMSATDIAFLSEALGVSADDLLSSARGEVFYRKADNMSEEAQAQVAQVTKWLEDYVEDALFLDWTARHYGLG